MNQQDADDWSGFPPGAANKKDQFLLVFFIYNTESGNRSD